MYADTWCVKALQDNNHNHASRPTDCQDICHRWQSWSPAMYVFVCACTCTRIPCTYECFNAFCARVTVSESEDGWLFGSGSFQRTQGQPCSWNIDVWCTQWHTHTHTHMPRAHTHKHGQKTKRAPKACRNCLFLYWDLNMQPLWKVSALMFLMLWYIFFFPKYYCRASSLKPQGWAQSVVIYLFPHNSQSNTYNKREEFVRFPNLAWEIMNMKDKHH